MEEQSCNQLNLQLKSQILKACSLLRGKLISRYNMLSNSKRCFNSRSCKWILEIGKIPAQIWETEVNRTRVAGLRLKWQGYLLIQGRMMEFLGLHLDRDMVAKRETKRREARWLYQVLEVVQTSLMLLIQLLLQIKCPKVKTWLHKFMVLVLQKICSTIWYLIERKAEEVSKRKARRSALNQISLETHSVGKDSTKAKMNSVLSANLIKISSITSKHSSKHSKPNTTWCNSHRYIKTASHNNSSKFRSVQMVSLNMCQSTSKLPSPRWITSSKLMTKIISRMRKDKASHKRMRIRMRTTMENKRTKMSNSQQIWMQTITRCNSKNNKWSWSKCNNNSLLLINRAIFCRYREDKSAILLKIYRLSK